jgi:quercetin dioxygenase-like cupin family protein
VKPFRVGAEVAIAPRDDLLVGVTISPLTAPIAAGSPAQAAIFRIGAGGGIRRHPAAVPQILAVLSGSGEVAGEDGGFQPVVEGDAVFWAEGEEHETRSAHGMTVLIVEGLDLTPFQSNQR